MLDLKLNSAEDTDAFGRRLGALLHAGDVVILSGSLGAGKTAMTKGIAAGMGVIGLVTSPTFVIARVHPAGEEGRPGLVHVDAYRLSGPLELDDLDLDSDLERAAVVVEWGEGVAERLAGDHLVVTLERLPDDTRRAQLRGVGQFWEQRLAQLS
ncbi:tRNA (adenosine(37)-N6)-threonylcarbamoyltransferase complex ATPase subunit type 1 TsaE [Nakamurella antarctica]|uniref:tRNA threonylcarbamoyladenosine biosynthesis protein TsaE n=1 Tax=Nakamurella antarctica TaxID=1902245 RepID=A0A3G8ZW27_9ACTN|nr:tRNA (adenosine(37)-N6)-threonylcarbamoyltransferase complex ATPase subunit type 1 TsaE [Nakamurella antarctica]AZI58654.1 tRNA (adenosine(37)-N6)-threonylcarbamoyltransferase complex ATPase subunit type 1 TsaE [Nakamurella antarctica]